MWQALISGFSRLRRPSVPKGRVLLDGGALRGGFRRRRHVSPIHFEQIPKHQFVVVSRSLWPNLATIITWRSSSAPIPLLWVQLQRARTWRPVLQVAAGRGAAAHDGDIAPRLSVVRSKIGWMPNRHYRGGPRCPCNPPTNRVSYGHRSGGGQHERVSCRIGRH